MENQLLEEKVLQKVMENIPFGMVAFRAGKKRQIFYVNRAAYSMLGFSKKEYIKQIEGSWSEFMDVDLQQVIEEHGEEIRRGEEFEVIGRSYKKTGEEIYLLNRVIVRNENIPICYVNIIDVTERMKRDKRLQEERESLRRLATQDSFTGLLNRGTLEKKVNHALMHMNRDQDCAYLALDVDNFKKINDSYGHGVGDKLILEMAKLLKQQFAEDAYIGRMGGDEFAVFIRNCSSRDEIQQRADELLSRVWKLKDTMALQENPTVSIGIAFQNKAETSFEDLYHSADKALYYIKNREKNGIAILEGSIAN